MSSNRAGGRAASSPRPCECGCVTRQRRYPSDLADAQWEVIAPLLPVPLWQTPLGGRPEKHHRRAIVDAILYLAGNGIKWRAMPADFPPWRTVYGIFAAWSRDRVTSDLVDDLRAAARRAAGRDAEPSAGCIDAQSVHESAEGVVPAASSGFDLHKKVNGRKRHILVDTLGFLITVAVTPANVQDRDPAFPLLAGARRRGRHRLSHIWADNAYHGDWIAWAHHHYGITIEVVARPEGHDRVSRSCPAAGSSSARWPGSPAAPLRPRLRTPASPPRRHGPMGGHPADDKASRPRTTTPDRPLETGSLGQRASLAKSPLQRSSAPDLVIRDELYPVLDARRTHLPGEAVTDRSYRSSQRSRPRHIHVRSMFARMSRYGPVASGTTRQRLSRFAVQPGTS